MYCKSFGGRRLIRAISGWAGYFLVPIERRYTPAAEQGDVKWTPTRCAHLRGSAAVTLCCMLWVLGAQVLAGLLPDILCAVRAQHVPSSHHDSNYWTTNSGMPVWNNNSSLTVGTRGAHTVQLICAACEKLLLCWTLLQTRLCYLPLLRAFRRRADSAGGLCARHALLLQFLPVCCCAVCSACCRSELTFLVRVQHLIEKLAQVRQ